MGSTPRPVGTPRMAKPDNPCPDKTFAVGYAGWLPGRYVTRNVPERYIPKKKTEHSIGSVKPDQIYLGDLTQEWNIGEPYRRTHSTYGEWFRVKG